MNKIFKIVYDSAISTLKPFKFTLEVYVTLWMAICVLLFLTWFYIFLIDPIIVNHTYTFENYVTNIGELFLSIRMHLVLLFGSFSLQILIK